jgi:hypothetical protein
MSVRRRRDCWLRRRVGWWVGKRALEHDRCDHGHRADNADDTDYPHDNFNGGQATRFEILQIVHHHDEIDDHALHVAGGENIYQAGQTLQARTGLRQDQNYERRVQGGRADRH